MVLLRREVWLTENVHGERDRSGNNNTEEIKWN